MCPWPRFSTIPTDFQSLEQVPAVDALRQKIAALLGGEMKILDGKTSGISVGATPTVRTFVRFTAFTADVTLIHDSPELIMQVNVCGPIENLYRIDTLMLSLGGRPRFGQKSWQATMRARKWGKVRKVFVAILSLATEIFTIYHWGWLGLIAVVLLNVALVALCIVMLAKSFRH